MIRAFVGALGVLAQAVAAMAEPMQSSAGPLDVQAVASGLIEPWSIAFLPDGAVLVTERGGRLLALDGGRARPVSGVPDVAARGQGGLFDVLVPRDFARTREILLSYAASRDGRAVTTLARARLAGDPPALSDLRVIFAMASPSTGGLQFGGRIAEAPDGRIFVTLGDRGAPDTAQDLANHNGTVIRLNRDGSVPSDNPFAGVPGAQPEIWSYGHRNPQGAAFDAAGQLWVNEHGARGGDEVNRIRPGANYGWPVIAFGRNYDGTKIGIGTLAEGMEQPARYWDPSIAPSGMLIYSGRLWPQWRGDFFVGSLKFDYISRLDPNAGWSEERLQNADTGRVRDLREAPDGSIWFLSVDNGALYRIVPGR